MMNLVIQSLLHVLIPVIVLTVLVFKGLFDSAHTEVGYEHYAEEANPDWGFVRFPSWLKMPGNTIVNVGYCIVGLTWIYHIIKEKQINERGRYMYYIFCWQAIMYGGVQYARISTQLHQWAILDQWFTLPFFAWVPVWSGYLMQGWNGPMTFLTMLMSILSYLPHTLYHRGFEIALGIHIVFAVVSAVRIHRMYPVQANLTVFVCAVVCCSGFVFLKLADHYLASFLLFRYLTGHFWSKVCDFLQIHFVCQFFFNIDKSLRSIRKEE
ncbi:transmembrane protein 187-like [Ptychodera flava]|uniref:transmembrane protein 187-like n=1 Tax=Ptychodera flava TaxID=63121 RepID=UPI003969D029